MAMIKAFGNALGALVLVVAVGLGAYLAFPALGQLVAPAESAKPVSPPPLRTVAHPDTSVTATITEAELTDLMQPYFPQSFVGVVISEPRARIAAGRIVIDAKAQAFFGQGPLEAAVTPSTNNGKVIVHVDSVFVSGRTMPDAVSFQLQTRLQEAIDAMLVSRIWVVKLTADSGTLTLDGAPLP